MLHMRMQLMIEAWPSRWSGPSHRCGGRGAANGKASVQLAGQGGTMRAADHQFQQALAVG